MKLDLELPINLAAHFQILSNSKVLNGSKSTNQSLASSKANVSQSRVFDTSTGRMVKPPKEDLINELEGDSICLMQSISIKGRTVLTLFDRGANASLIEGKLAEELELKVIDDEPTVIGVVSGGKVWAQYGTYSMYLGPTQAGKFHEITCTGIKAITSKIPAHNLDEVNAETRVKTNLNHDVVLPPSVGGDRIGLLIGLRDIELDPKCVFHLPSGIGLYESPFVDSYGSRYCYGGPSSAFTAANERYFGNANHIQIYFTQIVNQYRNSLYPALSQVLDPELIPVADSVLVPKDSSLLYSYNTDYGDAIYKYIYFT